MLDSDKLSRESTDKLSRGSTIEMEDSAPRDVSPRTARSTATTRKAQRPRGWTGTGTARQPSRGVSPHGRGSTRGLQELPRGSALHPARARWSRPPLQPTTPHPRGSTAPGRVRHRFRWRFTLARGDQPASAPYPQGANRIRPSFTGIHRGSNHPALAGIDQCTGVTCMHH